MTRPGVRMVRRAAVGLLASALLVGCEQQQRPGGGVRTQPAASQPAEHMANSDTERAAQAIDASRRDAATDRQPYDPSRSRPVDQPRVDRAH